MTPISHQSNSHNRRGLGVRLLLPCCSEDGINVTVNDVASTPDWMIKKKKNDEWRSISVPRGGRLSCSRHLDSIDVGELFSCDPLVDPVLTITLLRA